MNIKSLYLTKVIKIGNSEGIIIPQEIINAYKFQRGDQLIFGFAGTEELYLRHLKQSDIEKIYPIIKLD